MTRWFQRPLAVAITLGLFAQTLFCWRLTTPHTLVFDEVHYVPAARTLLEGIGHPYATGGTTWCPRSARCWR